MTMHFPDLARSAVVDGDVSPHDILALRRLGWGDGRVSPAEAEAIFAINRALVRPSGEWVDFFVEALSEFVLNGTPPRGMCSEDEAQWLKQAIDQDGRLETMAELELLVRVIERAQNVPDSLKHYALRQLEAAVLTGTGPTRCGGELSDTHMTGAECRLIRRLVFASGGDGPATVSRLEAEMLFRLKAATLGADNSPEWARLFVDGVANYLRGFTLANSQLSHARLNELEGFIADNQVNLGRFFGAMARELPQVRRRFSEVSGANPDQPNYGELAADGNLVTESEQHWLDGMVHADHAIDVLERALLDRVAQDLG